MLNNDYDQLLRSIYNDDFQQVNKILDNQNKDYTGKRFQIQHYMYSNYRFDLPTEGLTLMHVAAFCNSIETFKILKERGHELGASSDDSYLPIHYACYSKSQQIVEYILSNDPNEARILPPVEHHLIDLSIRAKSADMLCLLIQHGADLHAPENQSCGPIEAAIKFGNPECVRVLLENGMKPLEEHKEGSFTMTMLAIFNQVPEVIPLLFEAGDDLSYYDGYETALSLACFLGYLEGVRLICDHLEQIDIDPSLQRMAAVHWICQSKNPEIARTVLSKGIDVNRLDEEGHAGTFYLVDLADEDVTIQIIELLCEYGFDVNIKCISADGTPQNSVLGDFVYSIHRPIKVIDWLLDHGADPYAKLVPQNKRIIDFAQNPRNIRLLQVFEKHFPIEMARRNSQFGRKKISPEDTK